MNEKRYNILWDNFDKTGIDSETLSEIQNIVKRISVIRFKNGRISLIEDDDLQIRLVMEDDGFFFSIHTLVGPGVVDGQIDADMIYSLWHDKDDLGGGFYWLDDFIELFREKEKLMILNRVHPRKDRVEAIKDTYYENIYGLKLDKQALSALKKVCEKVVERLSFKTANIEYKDGRFYTSYALNYSVQLDIFFNPGQEIYNYYFSRKGKNIDGGSTRDLDEIVELWYSKIELDTRKLISPISGTNDKQGEKIYEK